VPMTHGHKEPLSLPLMAHESWAMRGKERGKGMTLECTQAGVERDAVGHGKIETKNHSVTTPYSL
jgi:hypothetical protein